MKKKLVLHIGMPKTGTSTIQNTLKLNKKSLSDQGLFYPTFDEYETYYNHKQFYSTGNGNLLAYAMRKEQGETSIIDFPSFDNVVTEICTTINNSSTKTTIISHEDLIYMWPILIENMISQLKINNIELSVVLYIREQVSFHLSNYQQLVRQVAETCSFTEYLSDQNRMNSAKFTIYTEKWEKYLKKDNLIVKLLDKSIIDNYLGLYFLNSIGYQPEFELVKEHDANVGLGKLAIEILRQININANKLNSKLLQMLKNFAYSKSLKKIDDTLTLDRKEKKYIINFYKESNKELANKFLSSEEKDILCD